MPKGKPKAVKEPNAVPEAYRKELAKKGYEEVERAPILKWAELGVGYEVEGIFCGLKQGKYEKPLLKIRDENGTMLTFGCPTILESKLEGVMEGDSIVIVCKGKREVEGQPNAAWDFLVFRRHASTE